MPMYLVCKGICQMVHLAAACTLCLCSVVCGWDECFGNCPSELLASWKPSSSHTKAISTGCPLQLPGPPGCIPLASEILTSVADGLWVNPVWRRAAVSPFSSTCDGMSSPPTNEQQAVERGRKDMAGAAQRHWQSSALAMGVGLQPSR